MLFSARVAHQSPQQAREVNWTRKTNKHSNRKNMWNIGQSSPNHFSVFTK
jgi:hypothetical protein